MPTDTVPANPLHRLAPALAALACAAVRLPLLVRDDFWFDEVFSFVAVSGTWGDLFAFAVADQVNPPGFYVLAKLWLWVGGESEIWMRLLPCLLGIALGPIALRFLRTLNVAPVGQLLGVALVASSPLLTYLSVEFRAYAAFTLLVGGAHLIAAQIILTERNPSRRTWWLLGSLLSVAILFHYFAAFAALSIVAAAWWTGRFRRRFTLVAGVAPLATLLPWALVVVREMRAGDGLAQNARWILKPTLVDLGTLPTAFVGGGAPALALAIVVIGSAGAIVLGLANAFRATGPGDTRTRTWQMLTAYGLVPVVLVFAASWILPHSMWVPRYLSTVALPFIALIAFAADRRPRVARLAMIAAVGWSLVVSVPDAYRARPTKTEWRKLARHLTEGGRTQTTVFAFEGYLSLPLTYNARRENVPLTVATTLRASSEPAWVLYRAGGVADSALFDSAARAMVTLGPPISIDERDSTYVLRRIRP